MQQPKWTYGETYETDRPADVEKSVGRVKVRRNIKRETRTTEDGTRKIWVYEYANMTQAQYDTYKEQLAELESPLALLITENNTVQLGAVAALYEEMLATQENQIAIMAGIAEIYETGVNAV